MVSIYRQELRLISDKNSSQLKGWKPSLESVISCIQVSTDCIVHDKKLSLATNLSGIWNCNCQDETQGHSHGAVLVLFCTVQEIKIGAHTIKRVKANTLDDIVFIIVQWIEKK